MADENKKMDAEDHFIKLMNDTFSDKLSATARDLEKLAAAVRRVREEFDAGSIEPLEATGRVQHTVLWGLANIGLDGLTAHCRSMAKVNEVAEGRNV